MILLELTNRFLKNTRFNHVESSYHVDVHPSVLRFFVFRPGRWLLPIQPETSLGCRGRTRSLPGLPRKKMAPMRASSSVPWHRKDDDLVTVEVVKMLRF